MSKTYWFTIEVEGIDDLTDEMVDALHENGCDDSTPSVCGDVVEIQFAREAESLDMALFDAGWQVATALKGKFKKLKAHFSEDDQ